MFSRVSGSSGPNSVMSNQSSFMHIAHVAPKGSPSNPNDNGNEFNEQVNKIINHVGEDEPMKEQSREEISDKM